MYQVFPDRLVSAAAPSRNLDDDDEICSLISEISAEPQAVNQDVRQIETAEPAFNLPRVSFNPPVEPVVNHPQLSSSLVVPAVIPTEEFVVFAENSAASDNSIRFLQEQITKATTL